MVSFRNVLIATCPESPYHLSYAITSSGKKVPITGIFAHDSKNDLALLAVPGLVSHSVVLSKTNVKVGQRIYAIGSPQGLTNTISEGIVSGRRNLAGSELYQISAPISPGSSGGPIVDDKGGVIGIAVGAITSGQNLNFAIPIKEVDKLLASNSIQPLNIPATNADKSKSETTNLTDGVKVVDISTQGILVSDCLPRGGDNVKGISIRNNLSSPISRIKVLLILYNASNEPIDSKEVVLCKTAQYSDSSYTTCDAIPPGLAKYFDLDALRKTRALCIAKGEKFKIRVLSFDLAE
jgi:hypothetical protein